MQAISIGRHMWVCTLGVFVSRAPRIFAWLQEESQKLGLPNAPHTSYAAMLCSYAVSEMHLSYLNRLRVGRTDTSAPH